MQDPKKTSSPQKNIKWTYFSCKRLFWPHRNRIRILNPDPLTQQHPDLIRIRTEGKAAQKPSRLVEVLKIKWDLMLNLPVDHAWATDRQQRWDWWSAPWRWSFSERSLILPHHPPDKYRKVTTVMYLKQISLHDMIRIIRYVVNNLERDAGYKFVWLTLWY